MNRILDSSVLWYYRLDDRGSRPGRSWEFFFSAPRPDRFWVPPMSTRARPWGVKRLGRKADHLPPTTAEVKNSGSYTSTPPLRIHGVVLSLKSTETTSPFREMDYRFTWKLNFCAFLCSTYKIKAKWRVYSVLFTFLSMMQCSRDNYFRILTRTLNICKM
jgi:hypothetical protein